MSTINHSGTVGLFLYAVFPIITTYLLCELATTGRPVQRKGWKNWFLLAVSILFAIGILAAKTLAIKIMLATGHTGGISYTADFLFPTAVVVAAVTLSLRSSRYLPGAFLAPVGIVATTLVPSFIQVMKTPATYEGTLPAYVPLAVFMLLPLAVMCSAVANYVAFKRSDTTTGADTQEPKNDRTEATADEPEESPADTGTETSETEQSEEQDKGPREAELSETEQTTEAAPVEQEPKEQDKPTAAEPEETLAEDPVTEEAAAEENETEEPAPEENEPEEAAAKEPDQCEENNTHNY